MPSIEETLVQKAIDESLSTVFDKRLKELSNEQKTVIELAVEKRLRALIDLKAQERMDEPEVQQKIQELVDRYTEGRAESAVAVKERLLEQAHAAEGQLEELKNTRDEIAATIREVRTLERTEAAIRKAQALGALVVHPLLGPRSDSPTAMKYGEFGMCCLVKAVTGLDPSREFVDFGMLSGAIESLLSQHTPRERTIIEERFGLIDGCRHTYEDVGKTFNVTRERIRQQEHKLLRIFRHPSRSGVLKDALFERSTTSAIQEIRNGIEELAGEVNTLLGAVSKIVKAAESGSARVWDKASAIPDEIYNKPIHEHIKLPLRATNVLQRTGVRCIGELVTKTESQLLAMRNLGVGTVADIKNALSVVGLSLSDES